MKPCIPHMFLIRKTYEKNIHIKKEFLKTYHKQKLTYPFVADSDIKHKFMCAWQNIKFQFN